MADKRFVVSKDMMTTELNIVTEKEKVADAAALRGLDTRINSLETDRVTGVKGDAESTYRTGYVNITSSQIGALPTSEKGSIGGVAELDNSGHVPSSQLPSYVDDIIEGYYNTTDGKFYKESTYITEIPGEDGKIYVSLDTNLPYRWSGSAFVEIPWGLALGETSSTAYRGDRGKIAYDDSQANKAAIALIDADFAPVEDMAAAASSYAVGKYLISGHILYRVIAPISVGDPISVNTNVTAITITQELLDNYVSGVKGNAESTYRKGNVNITPADLGLGTAAEKDVANNLTTSTDGYVLDARQGPVISGSILSISGRVDDIEENISVSESTSTATHSYGKNEYLTYQGDFYKVTTPISIGDTLIPGTNITPTTIANELGGGAGGGGVCFLGDCATAASTATKAVTVSDPNFTLKTGTEIVVQYTYTNTAQNPTISVNGGTAKSIYYGSAVVTTEKLDIAAGTAGEFIRYVYDGTYWVWIGHGKDVDAGHTIITSSGTALAQEEGLQFVGMNVEDDSTNKKTIVRGQIVKVTSAEYEALSTAAKNDPNITYEVTDTPSAESIASTITITASGWSNSTVTVDSVAYYTHETALATVFDSHPDIYLGALSTFPTSAEKQAYMAVDYITVDAATNKLKCYARSKPGANFVIVVKGVTV